MQTDVDKVVVHDLDYKRKLNTIVDKINDQVFSLSDIFAFSDFKVSAFSFVVFNT